MIEAHDRAVRDPINISCRKGIHVTNREGAIYGFSVFFLGQRVIWRQNIVLPIGAIYDIVDPHTHFRVFGFHESQQHKVGRNFQMQSET